MNQDLISLAIERGRLLERISNQRQLLGQQLQPVGDALETADRAVAAVRKAGTYLGQHPEVVAAGVVVQTSDGQIVEEGTPEHFFTNPKNERVRQFLSKIVR